MNVVITGASRGIGLELTRIALERGDEILAVARSVDEEEVVNLKSKWKDQLLVLPLDITDEDFTEKLVDANNGRKIDVLINNAGIYTDDNSVEDFLNSFHINTVAPFFINKSMLPFLKKSAHPRSIQISSKMGSITDNSSGGSYAYRSSKAALNMIVKSLSIDEAWLTVVAMHPGWVKTRMGGNEAPISVQDSANGLWQVIQQLRTRDSGLFFDHEGNKLPW